MNGTEAVWAVGRVNIGTKVVVLPDSGRSREIAIRPNPPKSQAVSFYEQEPRRSSVY